MTNPASENHHLLATGVETTGAGGAAATLKCSVITYTFLTAKLSCADGCTRVWGNAANALTVIAYRR